MKFARESQNSLANLFFLQATQLWFFEVNVLGEWVRGGAARYRLTLDLERPSSVSGMLMTAQVHLAAEETNYLVSLVKLKGLRKRVHPRYDGESEFVLLVEKLFITEDADNSIELLFNLPNTSIKNLKQIYRVVLQMISDGYIMIRREYFEEWNFVLLTMLDRLEEESRPGKKNRQWRMKETT